MFSKLKEAIAYVKSRGIEVFLSVGGWDYSCNPYLYCKSLNLYGGSPKDCSKSAYYSYVCEPQGYAQTFDWFPDPTDPSDLETA